jgi:hypothetical protein
MGLNKWIFRVVCVFAIGMSSSLVAAEKWSETSFTTSTGQILRGYGSVSLQNRLFKTKDGRQAWVWEFTCQNAEKAQTLVGKFLADLELSPDLKKMTLRIDGQAIPGFKTASGAIFVGTVQGSLGKIVSAPDQATLIDFANQSATGLEGAVSLAAYPRYLDRFDRFGWGCYGMGGFNNYHGWMSRVDGKRTFKDPTQDVDFMIKHKFRFEPWLDPAGLDNSDGIAKNTEAEWMVKMLEDAGMPYSFRLYGAAGGADWTARRFGDSMEQPAKWMMCGFIRPKLHHKSKPHLSWYDQDIHRYQAVKTMDLMKPYADKPLNMGWMHPYGELEHGQWYGRHGDYSPQAQRHWRHYLQQKGITLSEASTMFTGDSSSYTVWEQVPIPEIATFAGLNGMINDLGGTWFYRHGRMSNDKKDANYPGLQEKWYQQALDYKTWKMVKGLPGSDRMYEALNEKKLGKYGTTWFRRTFTLDPASVVNVPSPRYLYWFPITHPGLHSGEYARYNKVFINGQQAGEIGKWGAIEVSKFLKPGTNEICVQLFGPYWQGRIFLSTEKPAVYPYLGKERNRLFLIWHDWDREAKYSAWAEILDGMRQVDPNRPIKFMAPIKFRANRWTKLARSWGGFAHNTGEGIWFYPWYKRYGFLYDVPASSELGGPANSIPKMFNGFRRTFLAGLNAHDPVFLAQTYIRNPELRQWWLDHNPVLKRMGKYDIDPQTAPQILIYRSTHGTIRLFGSPPYPSLGESTRKIQTGWDWDLGRGTLQTLGHSCLYLDDQGLSDGKMNGFNVMVDSGNETIPENSLDSIKAWVKAGGTYITLPFSGRNTELEPDTWKIGDLTGCKIGKLRDIGQGTVTIGKKQHVFKALAGRTFPDNGKSLDYIGNNFNFYSVELEPGENSEVLAVYENGKPAIVRHTLGRGQVIALGSAFWRDCQDRMGLWWPEPLETDFWADLFAGIDCAPPVCTTNDRLVWAQPYRSNNGLDAVTCLVSWHEEKASEVTLTLRLPRRPAKLVAYGVDGRNELDFTWKNGIATAKVDMPAKEVKVINAVVHTPGDAVAHWWKYQQKMWHQLKDPSIDFSPYRQGKWVDPTFDLRQGGAELSLADPATGKAEWKPCQVSILNFWGAEANKPVWLRKTFRVPQEWKDQGGRIFLVSGAWYGGQYEGSARLSLNGAQLHDWSRENFRDQEFDVTTLLTDGTNEVRLQFKGDQKYQGVKGQLYLYHWTPPARRVSLAGTWQATDIDRRPITVQLPGSVEAWDLTRKVFIPEEWRGKVRIRLYMDGSAHATLGAYVNERQVRRHHHCFNTVGDLDITNFLRFGKENTLNLMHRGAKEKRDVKRPLKWDLKTIELHLRPVQ